MSERRHELIDHFPQRPRASALVRCGCLLRDARSAPAFACEPAVPLQFRIGARDGVRRNAKIARELSNRGQ